MDHDEETFEVLERFELGKWCAMLANFPNCPNSNKVMVYCGNSPSKNARSIDPHFGRDGSPIARFTATEMGWDLAKQFVCRRQLEDLKWKRFSSM